jgi:hypothetical protein
MTRSCTFPKWKLLFLKSVECSEIRPLTQKGYFFESDSQYQRTTRVPQINCSCLKRRGPTSEQCSDAVFCPPFFRHYNYPLFAGHFLKHGFWNSSISYRPLCRNGSADRSQFSQFSRDGVVDGAAARNMAWRIARHISPASLQSAFRICGWPCYL